MSPHKTSDEKPGLKVVIVGAGLGGLAAAIAIHLTGRFQVLVLEAATVMGEIGAGLQVSPNCSRLLQRWGCEPYLRDRVVLPQYGRVVRWQDGEVLSQAPMNPNIEQKYHAPHWHVHRADLHDALLQRVKELGISVRVNAKVIDADMDKPSVTLHTGEVIGCDFIVGADGLRSAMRDIMFSDADGDVPAPQVTGDYAYRFIIPTEDMAGDTELADLVEVPMAVGWWGPHKHVVGYKLRNETIFNVVTVFPDDGSMENIYKASGDIEHMKELYKDWCPEVRSLLKRAKPGTITKWKLMDLDPLPRWSRGRLVLLGDACHPMLPYMAQGASQAVEDAAALAQCLLHLPSDAVGDAYEHLRYSRGTQIQKYARVQRGKNHMVDGPEQEARDAALKDPAAAMRAAYSWKWEPVDGEPAKSWNDGLFGYDAEEEALKYIEKIKMVDGVCV